MKKELKYAFLEDNIWSSKVDAIPIAEDVRLSEFLSLTQVNHIRICLYESMRSDTEKKAKTDAILEWLSSLTTLTKLEGYMSPSLLHQFLHQTRIAGPIELVTFKHRASWEDYPHLDKRLHHHQQIMNELMGRKVIFKFLHRAQCSCQRGCLIKSQFVKAGLNVFDSYSCSAY